jgi:hypothetical protein
MSLANIQIAASPTLTTVYTSSPSAGSTATAITTLIFCNTASPDPTISTTLTLYAVPNGGAAGISNMILNALAIPNGETFTFDTEKLVLSSGDAIYAIASTTNITATISYMSV